MTLVRKNTAPVNYWSNDFVNMMNRIFDENLNGFNNDFKPAVNIQETKENFVLELEVPGIKKEDFHIKFENNQLEISAETNEKKSESNDTFIRKEFSKRSFKRSFKIAENLIDNDKISATYENGILTLNLPKREEAKPKPAKEIAIA